ncbi:MAG: 16S rRNA (uracil(1498)-N(3))-methyltransferase [Bacillota bacterium]
MPKFFVDPPYVHEKTIEITGDDAKHIANVLRCQVGEELVLCDGSGYDYFCKIADISDITKLIVTADILDKRKSETEPDTKIVLFQGLPKADKMELIIQKAVELGVDTIVPVSTERTIVKLDKKENKKIERWQKIAEAAAKQSFRGKIPEIHTKVLSMKEALSMAKSYNHILIPYEKEETTKLKDVIPKMKHGESIGIFIGPEGGFSESEIDQAMSNNAVPVTLGKRILRTETAGMMVIGILLHELEE